MILVNEERCVEMIRQVTEATQEPLCSFIKITLLSSCGLIRDQSGYDVNELNYCTRNSAREFLIPVERLFFPFFSRTIRCYRAVL